MHLTIFKRVWVLLSGALTICAAFAQAPTVSNKTIRIVVPFAAGSYTDNVIRLVAPTLSERLSATIIVDNKPGANGMIGADMVAKAAPDGTTFLMGGASVNAANPSLYKSMPYDPVRDLIPVSRFGVLPFLLVVNPKVPIKSVPDLIEYSKKNPGKLAYATPNSATLVGMESLKRAAGIDILQVPYKSSPQAMLDLISDQVQVLIADFATAMPHVKANNARIISVTMLKRSSQLPDIPATSETLKGYDISAWNGLFAPAGTSKDVMNRVNDAVQSALATKEVQEKLIGIGFDILPLGPDTFGPYVRDQISTWAKLIQESGIKPE